MRVFSSALVAGVIGQVLTAAPSLAAQPCEAALASLQNEWNQAGFAAPAKPMQAVVYGAPGHVSSGPEVRFMQTQMHLAAIDCAHGDSASAMARIAKVHALLNPAVKG